MRHWVGGLLILYFCTTVAARSQSSGVLINGEPNEPFWQKLAPMKLVPTEPGVPVDMGGEVRCAIAGGYLYLSARLPEHSGHVTARSMGWPAFWEAVIFVGVLAAALLYLWRVGALDWSSASEKRE